MEGQPFNTALKTSISASLAGALQPLAHIQKTRAVHPIQPFVTRAGSHIDVHFMDIDGNDARHLNDIGIDQGAMAMGYFRDFADVFQVSVDV